MTLNETGSMRENLEKSSEKSLEQILNDLKSKIEEYKHKELPDTGRLKGLINNEEHYNNYINSFCASLLNAKNHLNARSLYNKTTFNYADKERLYFTYLHGVPNFIYDELKDLLNPLIEYHINHKKTILSKNFLYNVATTHEGISNNREKSLIYDDNFTTNTKNADFMAKFIENNDFQGLSDYIDNYIQKIIDDYEKEINNLKETSKFYIFEKDEKQGITTIFSKNNRKTFYIQDDHRIYPATERGKVNMEAYSLALKDPTKFPEFKEWDILTKEETTEQTNKNIKNALEKSPEEKLEEILNDLRGKIDGYREIQVDIKSLVPQYRQKITSLKNAEEAKKRIKDISESFYGTIKKAIGEQNNIYSYKSKNIEKAFTTSPFTEIPEKRKITELITPLIKYHSENTPTKFKKEFITNIILFNNPGVTSGKSEDEINDSIIEGEEKINGNKISKLDIIGKYIDNDDYDGLSEYIKEYTKIIADKYEKKLLETINEKIQTYVLEENQKDGSTTIITGNGKIYKLTKGGRQILIDEDRKLLKNLKEMGALKEFDATKW